MNSITFVGLDVHKERIAVAVARDFAEVEDIGMIQNNPQSIAKLARKLGPIETLVFCYEAGPCGYGIYRQLNGLGAKCCVVASSLVPERPGDRVKTDRRDARKLARLLRAGELTPVWVPDEEHEAFRQLVRAREVAKDDAKAKKQQIGKLLLQNNIKEPGGNPWTLQYMQWLNSLRFDSELLNLVMSEYLHALSQAEEMVKRLETVIAEASKVSKLAPVIQGLQALRGVSLITASTIVAEAGDITRFHTPRKLMAYSGLVPTEHSSGDSRRQGPITRTGNSRLRRVLVEAAWHYRHQPRVGERLKQRQKDLPQSIKDIAWKAQHRLNRKYMRQISRGKNSNLAVVAIARELLGFVWAIAQDASMIQTKAAN